MLNINNVVAGYGDLEVLHNISIYLEKGEVVSIVGSNGAGKTTLLAVISGLVNINSGELLFDGTDLSKVKSYKRADLGIAHIPQGRGILNTITVEENLILGSYPKAVRKDFDEKLESAYSMFPILYEKKNQQAGELSGGQQQMLSISRALMLRPKLLMLDEPSLGLAPILVEEIFLVIRKVAESGMSILLVEQNLNQALAVADRGYVLETGKIVKTGDASELMADEKIKEAYLGI